MNHMIPRFGTHRAVATMARSIWDSRKLRSIAKRTGLPISYFFAVTMDWKILIALDLSPSGRYFSSLSGKVLRHIAPDTLFLC